LSFKKICQWCVHHEAVQRGEVPEDAPQPVIAAPWVRRGEAGITLTQVLFGANLAVFIAMVLASGPSLDFTGQVMVRFGANYGRFTLSGQWWRLVTYMFLHGSLMHIGFNMWCLWDLGALAESLYGRWTFGAIYLITGIGGGLASIAWNPGVLSVGASGAIFGLAGALIASFYLGEFSLPSIAIRGTLRSLVVFAGFNLFFGSVVGGIDNACHIGGLVSGLILGALIARVAPDPYAVGRRVSVVLLVAVVVAGSALGVQRWRGFPTRFGLTMQSLSENDPNRAIARLQAVIRQRPNSVEAHFALADVYFSKAQYAQAEVEFKRVLELQPKHKAARFQLGMTYLNEKRPKDAEDLFRELLAENANDADARFGLALALADEGDHQAAIHEYIAAAKLSDFPGLNYSLGLSYAKLKMFDEAIAAYAKERDKNGDDFEIENALADAYQAKGMTQQAQEARSKAAQLKGQTAD
jgi:membrane associated rhomboid family serine protease